MPPIAAVAAIAEPADRRKEHTRQNTYQRQTTWKMSDQRIGKIDDSSGNTALNHQTSGKDKQRNRNQRQVLSAPVNIL